MLLRVKCSLNEISSSSSSMRAFCFDCFINNAFGPNYPTFFASTGTKQELTRNLSKDGAMRCWVTWHSHAGKNQLTRTAGTDLSVHISSVMSFTSMEHTCPGGQVLRFYHKGCASVEEQELLIVIKT